MTLVTGTVQDLGHDGMEGTLWARPARFRSDGQVVYAPERKPYKVVDGVVSADLAPGPAVLELQVGSHARGTFEVVIPDTDIGLADLLDTVFPWEPAQVSLFVAEREAAEAAKRDAEQAATLAGTAKTGAELAAQQTGQDRAHVATDKDTVVAHVQALAEPNDAAVLGLISEGADTQTKAALNATYALAGATDARLYGVKADGVTDDTAAWNNVVATALPGTVLTWAGTSILRGQIVWKTRVSLIGQGWGRSVLITKSSTSVFPAIQWTPGVGASPQNPLVECTFANFEIDGSQIEHVGPNIAAKGIFTQWHKRCRFLNLYIHDTIGTGLGTDFLDDCLVHGVVAERNGRGSGPTGSNGHAGIGIGTGTWEEESTIVSDCHAIDNGNWGIFYEWQETEPFRGRGLIVTGCTARGNRVGFADRGTAGTVMTGCVAYRNREEGFSVLFGARGGRIAGGCLSFQNGGDGVNIERTVKGPYSVTGVETFENAKRGINAQADENTGLTVEGNKSYRNGLDGIQLTAGSLGIRGFRELVLSRNTCYDNGTAGSADGISIQATVIGGMIESNRSTDTRVSAEKTQRVGLRLPSGSIFVVEDVMIASNHLTGNSVTPFVLGPTSKPGTIIRDNSGYVTENRGTMTIPAGSAAADVTHGLLSGTIPSTAIVTPRGNAQVYVTSRNGAVIRIARVGATTEALQVDWYVHA